MWEDSWSLYGLLFSIFLGRNVVLLEFVRPLSVQYLFPFIIQSTSSFTILFHDSLPTKLKTFVFTDFLPWHLVTFCISVITLFCLLFPPCWFTKPTRFFFICVNSFPFYVIIWLKLDCFFELNYVTDPYIDTIYFSSIQ